MNTDAIGSNPEWFAAPRHLAGLDRRAELSALVLILLLSLGLRLWGLEQNGWGAEYYSAAVKSMSESWHNFFFASFDPSGFISVDKPPIALWLQVASVKLFGFHPKSLLLPQVLEGVGSVWLLFHLVRRRFGAGTALPAALFFAIAPIWVAVNRTNNTDSCLLFFLLLATWALLKGAEEGSPRLLVLSAALVGLCFNIKMLAAYIVLPTFFLTYYLGASKRGGRRWADLAIAAAVAAAVSAPWLLACELTPAESRPYVGSSSRNSVLELVAGHNGVGRFVSRISPSARRGGEKDASAPAATEGERGGYPEMSHPRRILSRLFVRTPAGALRLLDGRLSAQAGWLLPFTVVAATGAGASLRYRRSDLGALSIFFWLCWSATYAAVYSYAGGIMHFYYLSTLAPALAALAAVGLNRCWGWYREQDRRAIVLPVAFLATAAWQLYIHQKGLGLSLEVLSEPSLRWLGWLKTALLGGTFGATLLLSVLLLVRVNNGATRAVALCSAGAAVLSLLVLPSAWALSSVLVPGHGVLPSADLYRLAAHSLDHDAITRSRLGKPLDLSKLVDFLRSQKRGEKYLLATSTIHVAAPIIIGTDESVMARGGFHGLDPAVTPEQLKRMVDERQVRFVMVGDVPAVSRAMGAEAAGKAVTEWVCANGREIPPYLWRSGRHERAVALYDLRPDAAP